MNSTDKLIRECNELLKTRQERRIETDLYMYRIRKECTGKEIIVYRHDRNREIERIMDDGKRHYEIKGELYERYPAIGKYRCTLKEVAELWAEDDQNFPARNVAHAII